MIKKIGYMLCMGVFLMSINKFSFAQATSVDKIEDVSDRLEDIVDRREDFRDRQEDRRDKLEDIKDRRDDIIKDKALNNLQQKREA
ncbi:MAG: hypothetical protein KAI91_05795, partial [Candidatus Omnitrophica bacterium]|nr:hypothetical protein [Candidatus Omnitrophota bacterium]